ncbi:MAG: chromosomal replication initiator protein DnaA [Anaerolineales bacterium]
MKPEQVWQAVLGELQLQMTRSTYDTWLRDTQLVAYEDGTYIVGCKSAYAKDWLENKLHATIKRTLSGIAGRSVEVRFVLDTMGKPEAAAGAVMATLPAAAALARPAATSASGLNARYQFENFVVGASNRLAHAACMAVAENPARAYNPLFLHGGVGLGKTHLLQAIGNACTRGGLLVLYVSSEEFTNDLINAIRSHTTEAFRDKYRNIDVLLVDDIQFIAGKESTQEEFFHTFNTLHRDYRQIVLSSDRSPKALVTLEERLRSRFEWGLTADIQPPDMETRHAILQAKADELHYQVPADVHELIARRVQSNIRELEGALNRVVAFAQILGHQLDLDTAAAALADTLPNRESLTPDHIIDSVADYYNVTVDALRGRDRSRDVALPRQMAMHLIREETKESLPQIGAALGGRDHTTIMYGCDKIRNLIETNDDIRKQALAIRERLYADAMLV